jgi:hypothetical protein
MDSKWDIGIVSGYGSDEKSFLGVQNRWCAEGKKEGHQ